jgi:hypothetical protein
MSYNPFDNLCNILNNLSQNIRPNLVNDLFSAIYECKNEDEFEQNPEIISSLRLLIISLASDEISESEALNKFMFDDVTSISASRRFFYNHMMNMGQYPVYLGELSFQSQRMIREANSPRIYPRYMHNDH